MRRFALLMVLLLAACDLAKDPLTPLQVKDEDMATVEAGERLEKSGNPKAAEAVYRRATAAPDAPANAFVKLAALYRKQGQTGDAVALLRDAQTKKPDDLIIREQLGYALIADGKAQEAVTIFDELAAQQPENAMFYNGKAVALDNVGNHVVAQELYQKALSLKADSVTIQNNLAMSYILNRQYKEAVEILEPLAINNRDNTTIRQNLALAHGLSGNSARAAEINRQTLSPQQAEDNLKFYKEYRTLDEKMSEEKTQ